MIPLLPTASLEGFEPANQPDFQFYICAGAAIIGQWQCPTFWLTALPRASTTSSAVKYGLLAMSASTRKWVETSPEALEVVIRRGDHYYGRACSLLRRETNATIEEALSTSFTLWVYDWFSGRRDQSFKHGNAAVKFYHILRKREMARTGPMKGSPDSMVEVARMFFRGMHFPVNNVEFLNMLEKRATSARHSSPEKLVHLKNPFTELAHPDHINSFFWLTVVATSVQELTLISEALDICAFQLSQLIFTRSRQQEIFWNQTQLFLKFCEYHICEMQTVEKMNGDHLFADILSLVQINMDLLSQERDHLTVEESLRNGFHCYLGVLAMVAARATDDSIRQRTSDLVTSHGRPKS